MIACLGWGSLIWDSRELPVLGEWFSDGPLVPIEFTRKSANGRITLVIDDDAQPVRVLWAQLSLTDLDAARTALKEREGITAKDWEPLVPAWSRGEPEPDALRGLRVVRVSGADILQHLQDTNKTGAHITGLLVGDLLAVFVSVDFLELLNGLLGELHGLSTIAQLRSMATRVMLPYGTPTQVCVVPTDNSTPLGKRG